MTTNIYAGLRLAVLNNPDDMDQVFALRYRAYLHEGAISPRESERFIDRYDLNRTSVTLGVVENDETIVGAIRLAVQPSQQHGIADYASAPEFEVFPEALDALLRDNRPIASGARFSIEPDHKRRTAIALLLIQAQVIGAHATGAKWGILTARGSHLNFYRRLLLMTPIAPPRRMPGLQYDYSLLSSDLDRNFQASMDRFPAACRAHMDAQHPYLDREIQHALPDLMLSAAA